jgi:DNA-binding CsgD family transcriptional regulator
LRAGSAESDRALHAALEQAGSHMSVLAPRAGAVLLRAADGAPLQVDVAPLPASVSSLRTGARVLVSIGLPTPRSRELSGELGLSPAETEVARGLVDGETLQDIADRRGVSVETVRAQLKSAYGKLGVHRQAELVRRLRDLV